MSYYSFKFLNDHSDLLVKLVGVSKVLNCLTCFSVILKMSSFSAEERECFNNRKRVLYYHLTFCVCLRKVYKNGNELEGRQAQSSSKGLSPECIALNFYVFEIHIVSMK